MAPAVGFYDLLPYDYCKVKAINNYNLKTLFLPAVQKHIKNSNFTDKITLQTLILDNHFYKTNIIQL